MKLKATTPVKNIITILAGAFIFAIGINFFAIPSHLAEGGITGVALLIHYISNIKPALVILILNIPLLVIGYKYLGKRTFIYTVIGIGSLIIMLEITKIFGETDSKDIFLNALFTGVLVGSGLGLVFRVGGTTGGGDIIARIINLKYGMSIGGIMFMIDFIILTSSVLIIGLNKAMYTLVAVFVGSRVVDFVMEGINRAKAATIISQQPETLAKLINETLRRGVTIIKGSGGYTGQDKKVLYVVLAPTQLLRLKQLVNQIDPDAFVVVNEAKEVLGRGFSQGR